MSAAQAKILQFPQSVELAEGTNSAVPTNQSMDLNRPVIEKVLDHNVATELIAIDDLYPDMVAVRPEFNTALRLLAASVAELEAASQAASTGADILADEAVQRFQGKLPELFCCRDLGNSFGAIVNATINALHNRHGDPLSLVQIESLRDTMQTLRSQPFMEFDEAVSEITAMEDAGLVVEPAEFEILADWLDE